MEKIRIFVLSFLILLLGILVFSLTKSWLVYDKGIQVIPVEEEKLEEDSESQRPEKKESIEDWQENARIYWKSALLYPLGLSTESGGFGPDGIMYHARNIIVVNLQTGKLRKLFPKNVYIWDYFPANINHRSGVNSGEDMRSDTLYLENKVFILAATRDTNQDGFLNNKDKKKVFLYDTLKDRLIEVLPDDGYFEKIIWNAGNNRLTMVIRRGTLALGEKPSYQFSGPLFFIYDAATGKRTVVDILE